MAKVGLKFDKVEITDKRYLDITPALNVDEVFGKLTWRGINEVEQKYEDDTTQPRNQDGTYPQVPTGEILSTKVAIKSANQHGTEEFSVIGMMPSEIEGLGLKFGDEVELSGIIVTYSSVSGGVYKLFAQGIHKKGATAPKPDNAKAKE
ncbi:hypothetical protein [Streptococcus dysgalactiae]|uniref:hypothetical protein n=1 Tax=Streptococcus dysgalactiae TaxID=1334 RepID=UPI001867A864|nr:hypothetical protein [Streptococcus dysgalactiae]